jgi:hypothetical protein
MSSSHAIRPWCQWLSRLASALDPRSAPRLALLFLGSVLARGRRTVTTRMRTAGLSDRFHSCYIAVAAAGQKADRIASRVLTEVVLPLVAGAGRLTLALDDTPTKRYGPQVQGPACITTPPSGRSARPTSTATIGTVISKTRCSNSVAQPHIA